MYDVDEIRGQFPILSRKVNGTDLVYLDNGASAQKPQIVIDAVTKAYTDEYANVHRGLHYLSSVATEKYEAVRKTIARFLNAEHEDEILFTSGGTAGFNLISYAWAAPRLQAGDEILVSVMEHHANIVPWHFLRERQGVVLNFAPIEADGALDVDRLLAMVTPKTKLIAVTHVSNVLGTCVDVAAICRGAKALGVPVLVDGCQGAVHLPVNVQDIGCDFYVITGHKLYGPSGSGAIYVSRERQAEMRPFMGGGDMIRMVTQDSVTYADAPMRFEAGTPAIVPMIGLGVALEWLMEIGMDEVKAHEASLADYAMARLSAYNWLQIHGTAKGKAAIFSLGMNGSGHAHDISTILDQKGIAVRAGTHCAMPLMQHLGLTASARASFGLYNTKGEVDRLAEGLELCHRLLA